MEGLYNTEKYGSLQEYLAAADAYIDRERKKNGVYMEGNTPTPEEAQYFGKPDGWEPGE